MPPHVKTAQRKQSHSPASAVEHTQPQPALQIIDQRPEAVVQRQLIEVANPKPSVAQLNEKSQKINLGSLSRVGRKVAEMGRTSLALRDEKSVPTKMGATMARRANRQDLIAEPDKFMSEKAIADHLGKFKDGAHAFITPYAHKQINGAWKGWGEEGKQNFVAPLGEAEQLHTKAITGEGIFTLEKRLGIKTGTDDGWAHPKWNPNHEMWRYVVKDPVSVGLKMATGKEKQAYQEEWIAGGKTLGGGNEATISSLRGEILAEAEKSGQLTREKITYLKTGNYMDKYFPKTEKTTKSE